MMGFCSSCRAFFGWDKDFANFVKRGCRAWRKTDVICDAYDLGRALFSRYNEMFWFIKTNKRNPPKLRENDI